MTARHLLVACALVALAAAILGASRLAIGPNTAAAGFVTILMLLAVMRAESWRVRAQAALWAVLVALLGYMVGGHGLVATLVALVVVSLVQGIVTVGETALLTRSPVNLLAFASLGQSGAQLWSVVLGSCIGAVVVLGFSLVTRSRERRLVDPKSMSDRLAYGVATAAGAVVISVVGELVHFPYTGWALLTFALVLSFAPEQRLERGYARLVGSVVGAVLATLLAQLPAPVPLIAAVVCMVLCVAFLNAGDYRRFVLFLTPAVLLTTSSEYSAVALGVLRVEAVLFGAVVAFACVFAMRRWGSRRIMGS
ncbi:FUSC family protein [Leucobacter japonicus]|uniref:FUSC family protein n=1 Tax=Leucobacter japonicus TaxID=1461259 RepID=UPI0006A77CD2|nr:FUSC family protein [Leucobacter japonicus]